jgi:hypothetical protein
MLTPSQIADMKHRDPDAFNLWRLVTEAINEFGLQMGVDPKPANQVDVAEAIPPPKAPKSINVVSIAGAVLVLLEAGEGNLPTAFYFVESSTTRTFQEVTRYTLGHGLHLAVPMPAGTTYWRANCKYQMSEVSPYTVFWTPMTATGAGGSPGVATQGVPEVFYSQSQTKTVSVTAETTLFAPAVPSLPASFFNSVDKSLRITAYGYFTNPTLGPSLNLRVKVGACQITTAARLLRQASSHFWGIEALFTCRTTGASGSLIGQGAFHYEHTS